MADETGKFLPEHVGPWLSGEQLRGIVPDCMIDRAQQSDSPPLIATIVSITSESQVTLVPDEIKPALSAPEWTGNLADLHMSLSRLGDGLSPMVTDDSDDKEWTEEESRHALAALALHGQRFGFTHEDLQSITDAIEMAEYVAQQEWVDPQRRGALESLKKRIAALLPPEGT